MMIAIAVAASAAAIAITKIVKNTPSNLFGHTYLLNAMKLRLTLFNTNSILISIVTRFRRVKKPYTPIKKSVVLMKRIWYNPGCKRYFEFYILNFELGRCLI